MNQDNTPQDILNGVTETLHGLVKNTDFTATEVIEQAEEKLDEKLEEERIEKRKETHKVLQT